MLLKIIWLLLDLSFNRIHKYRYVTYFIQILTIRNN
jgi:hypothetical protein